MMRRHVALLVLIVAIIIAIALLRPPRSAVDLARAAPPATTPRIETPPADLGSVDSEPSDSPASRGRPLAATKDTALKPEPQPQPPSQPKILTVMDPDNSPVPNATVFSVTHSYAQPSSHSKVKEWRTDDQGELKIVLGRNESAHFISYKVGVGSGITGEIRGDKDATLKYEKDLTVTFKCAAPHGVALEGAEVVLTTEVLLGTRRDVYGNEKAIVVALPPRKILTDREGISTFGAVLSPRPATSGWKAVPGICHGVKATWHTMVAQETIEKPPPGLVVLVLQQ